MPNITREYLTEREVERLMKAPGSNGHGIVTRGGWIEPHYEAEVAERLGMTLQILFGVVGMSMWLTP